MDNPTSPAQPPSINLPYDRQWQPIESVLHPDRPQLRYQMQPMWNFTAVYDGPDGEIEPPAGYADPGGALDWMVGTRHRVEINDGNRKALYAKWYYFGPRHIDRRGYCEHRAAGPDVPRPVSDTYQDMAKDWQHVMTFRDAILQREGLTAHSPPHHIAEAFAWELYRNWRGGGPRNHPADVLTHRAWCMGAANATSALLESLHIPCRSIGQTYHAVAEAYIDGRWRVIESSNHFINHEPTSTPWLPTDYVECSTHPTSPDLGDQITNFHRGIFYHFPQAHYGIPDGRWLRQRLADFCPATAHGLYPDRQLPFRFKTLDPTRLDVLVRDKIGSVEQFDVWHDLKPGQKLREGIWLDDVSDVCHFEWELRFYRRDENYPTAQTADGLEVHINGERFSVATDAAWPIQPEKLDAGRLRMRLPAGAFAGGQVNWIELVNTTDNQTYRIPLAAVAMEPYVNPLWQV